MLWSKVTVLNCADLVFLVQSNVNPVWHVIQKLVQTLAFKKNPFLLLAEDRLVFQDEVFIKQM